MGKERHLGTKGEKQRQRERDKEMEETWEMERNAPMRKDPQRDRGTEPMRGRARD